MMFNIYDYHNEKLDKYDEYYRGISLCTYHYIHNGNILNYTSIRHIIERSSEYASYYARYIIKGRWPEAEPNIMKNPKGAYAYARYVIGRRWKEAEPYIQVSNLWWGEYCEHFNI